MSDADAPALSINLQPARAWWREWQLAALIVLVLAAYFSRLTTLTVRGEESRRARVACEMLATGDWIVPRQQGELYFSRPPLGSWPIAMLGAIRGDVDLLAVRLPTAIATLLTAVLIYGYSRRFLSRQGSLASALAFATMGQVLELGRLAETEATFTLLVAGSLFVWHWGYVERWPATVMWCCGYALAALAGLAKGPQGPVYFVGPVFVFLLVTREWRTFLSRAHLLGIFSFALVLGAWQVPYYLATDFESVRRIWLKLASDRFADSRPTTLMQHLLFYPVEVLGCMLPWSFLLTGYSLRSFRKSLGRAQPLVLFLVTAILVTFPSVWLATGACGRYYMPLYPCFALLAGIVVDRCLAVDARPEWRRGWNFFLGAAAAVIAFVGTSVAIASVVPHSFFAQIEQPHGFAIVYFITMLGAAAMLVWACLRGRLTRSYAPLIVGSVMALTYTGAVINAQARVSEDSAARIAALRAHLPPGERLVSLGRVDHLFAYYYRDSIPVQAWPQSGNGDVPEDVHYFCFDRNPDQPPPQVPFAWEQVAVISLERHQQSEPERTVVVGRRRADPFMASRNSGTRLR